MWCCRPILSRINLLFRDISLILRVSYLVSRGAYERAALLSTFTLLKQAGHRLRLSQLHALKLEQWLCRTQFDLLLFVIIMRRWLMDLLGQ